MPKGIVGNGGSFTFTTCFIVFEGNSTNTCIHAFSFFFSIFFFLSLSFSLSFFLSFLPKHCELQSSNIKLVLTHKIPIGNVKFF